MGCKMKQIITTRQVRGLFDASLVSRFEILFDQFPSRCENAAVILCIPFSIGSRTVFAKKLSVRCARDHATLFAGAGSVSRDGRRRKSETHGKSDKNTEL
jgi:hypothetical protein